MFDCLQRPKVPGAGDPVHLPQQEDLQAGKRVLRHCKKAQEDVLHRAKEVSGVVGFFNSSYNPLFYQEEHEQGLSRSV